jgi:hypothetical protein
VKRSPGLRVPDKDIFPTIKYQNDNLFNLLKFILPARFQVE